MSNFIVDFQVTSRCNLDCNFCCGANKCKKDSSLDDIKTVIDKLATAGVDRVVITGGEPLLRRDIKDIISHFFDKGIRVYLSTNGYLIDDNLDIISKCVDCVGLPLDASTPELNKAMTRGYKQLETTMSAIRKLRKLQERKIIKIGTVVSKVNKDDIINLGKLLYADKILAPDVWRLYQFTPLGEGLLNRDYHEISDDDFKFLVMKVKAAFQDRSIGSLSNEESNDTYLFIAPDLEFVGLTSDDYVNLGNARDMDIEKMKALRYDLSKTLANAKKNRQWLESK